MSSDILFGFFILQTISRIFIGIFKSLGRFLWYKDLNKYLSNFKLQIGRIAIKTTSNQGADVIWMVLRLQGKCLILKFKK